MKGFLITLTFILGLGLYAFAQSSPAVSPSPAVSASPAATVPQPTGVIEGKKNTAPGAGPQVSALPTSTGGLIGLGLAIAAAFNGILSTAQIVLTKLGKAVPTWLPSVQSGVLSLVKFFGMNL